MIYSFSLPLPPTLNEQIAAARSHYTQSAALKKEWTQNIAAFVSHVNLPQLYDCCWASCTWSSNRQHDPDNLAAAQKFIFDGLQDTGIIRNDNLTVIQSPLINVYIPGDRGVVVTLSDSPATALNQAMSSVKTVFVETFVELWDERYPQIDLEEFHDGIFINKQTKVAIFPGHILGDNKFTEYAHSGYTCLPVDNSAEQLAYTAALIREKQGGDRVINPVYQELCQLTGLDLLDAEKWKRLDLMVKYARSRTWTIQCTDDNGYTATVLPFYVVKNYSDREKAIATALLEALHLVI